MSRRDASVITGSSPRLAQRRSIARRAGFDARRTVVVGGHVSQASSSDSRCVSMIALAPAVTAAIITASAAGAFLIIGVLLKHYLDGRRAVSDAEKRRHEDEEKSAQQSQEEQETVLLAATEQRRALRQKAKTHYEALANDLTATLAQISRGNVRRKHARKVYTKLQSYGKSEFRDAFGVDSAVVWAERRIRSALHGAIDLVDTAVREGDEAEIQAARSEISHIEFSVVDDALSYVLTPEMMAGVERADEVPTLDMSDASTPDARTNLDRLAREHGGHAVA